MTEHPRVAELKATATPLPTRAEILMKVRSLCRTRRREDFKLPHVVEDMTSAGLRAIKVSGTVYEPLEQVLADVGIPTDGTLGSLIDAGIGLTEDSAHMFCSCNYGSEETINGWTLELIYHGLSLRHP